MLPENDEDRQEALLGVVEDGVEAAKDDGEAERVKKAEEAAVAALWKEYSDAREFDKRARAQYSVDRRYASGTALISWAVSANLIGAIIDILSSFLYARNPDVSIKKAPQVDEEGTLDAESFAKTAEIIVSALWNARTTRMKENVRQFLRSIFTTGIGWFKATMICNGQNIPEMKAQLNSIQDNLKRYEQLRLEVTVDESGKPAYLDTDNTVLTEDQLATKTAEFNALQESLTKRIEVAERKMLALDFIASEDVQVSLDVRCITDYVNAKWVANRIYRPKSDARALLPLLTEEDVRTATGYFQRNIKNVTDISDNVRLTGLADESVQPDEADQYVASGKTSSSGPGQLPVLGSAGGTTGEQGLEYLCIVELWNHHDNHVYTMVDGVKKWAKQPYQPDYPSTRFFPYFAGAFYPVDGARHPQSLAYRLRELQDEYCSVRSSLRRTRSRAVPAVIFDSSTMDPTDAAKLSGATEQEFVPIKLDGRPIRDVVGEKPVASIDMRLYDTSPILADIEKLSGVQEALQSAVTTEKTATEAEIQQTGFSARTGSDRDVLETVLSDLAHYTLEQSLSALKVVDAQRIAGPKAFWPEGMAVDDMLALVQVMIEAGTTGKPKSAGDKQAWGVVLPILQQAIGQIRQAQLIGDLPTAKAQTELIKETMRRMGDESDVSRFIPQPPPALPGANPVGPGLPGAPLPPMGSPPADGPMPPAMAAGDLAGEGAPSLSDQIVPAGA